MIPPVPAGARSWDEWSDRFRVRHGREAFLDELVAAAMAVALGQPDPEPLTEEERAICGDRNRKPDPKDLSDDECAAIYGAPRRRAVS